MPPTEPQITVTMDLADAQCLYAALGQALNPPAPAATEGAPVDVTQSHDPFAPEGTQPAEQPETDALKENEPAPAPAPADPTPPQESAGPTEPQPEQPAPVPDPEAPDPSPSVPDPEPAAEPTPSEETPDVPAA